MGGASSGGSDSDVSGAEAVTHGGTTHSSRKHATVNKHIEETNKKNRESRKGILQKAVEKTALYNIGKSITQSKWSQNINYKKRMKFAKKVGLDTSLFSREFVLSKGFKDQLMGKGYLPDTSSKNGNGGTPPKTAYVEGTGKSEVISPTKAEVDQASATTLSADETLLATKKKGRSQTILTDATGLGETNLNIKKRKLGT